MSSLRVNSDVQLQPHITSHIENDFNQFHTWRLTDIKAGKEREVGLDQHLVMTDALIWGIGITLCEEKIGLVHLWYQI